MKKCSPRPFVHVRVRLQSIHERLHCLVAVPIFRQHRAEIVPDKRNARSLLRRRRVKRNRILIFPTLPRHERLMKQRIRRTLVALLNLRQQLASPHVFVIFERLRHPIKMLRRSQKPAPRPDEFRLAIHAQLHALQQRRHVKLRMLPIRNRRTLRPRNAMRNSKKVQLPSG